MLLSYRGQAQQRPGQFPVVSCRESQNRGAGLGVEGESDVLTGVIWVDKNESSEIRQKDKNTMFTCMSMWQDYIIRKM